MLTPDYTVNGDSSHGVCIHGIPCELGLKTSQAGCTKVLCISLDIGMYDSILYEQGPAITLELLP